MMDVPSNPLRYFWLLIFLHWVMAIAIIGMLGLGLFMANVEVEKATQFQLYQWHKSLGVLLLGAVLLRIVVRLSTRKPSYPENMKIWEKRAATLGHLVLYGFMLLLPLSGWSIVSSSSYGLPTFVFGWFQWPHIPNLTGNKFIQDLAGESHEWLAYLLIGMIIIHILAVVKHAIIDKTNLLARMGIGHVKKDL